VALLTVVIFGIGALAKAGVLVRVAYQFKVAPETVVVAVNGDAGVVVLKQYSIGVFTVGLGIAPFEVIVAITSTLELLVQVPVVASTQ
jgi:hypothetical protein